MDSDERHYTVCRWIEQGKCEPTPATDTRMARQAPAPETAETAETTEKPRRARQPMPRAPHTTSLAAAASRWADAKAAEREAMAAVHEAVKAAHADGMPLLQIEQQTGLNRRTVRAAAGLPRRP